MGTHYWPLFSRNPQPAGEPLIQSAALNSLTLLVALWACAPGLSANALYWQVRTMR